MTRPLTESELFCARQRARMTKQLRKEVSPASSPIPHTGPGTSAAGETPTLERAQVSPAAELDWQLTAGLVL